jgi:hypothetical protein
MKYNEILEGIYRQRAEHARECGFDVHKLFQQIREGTKKLKAEGWRVVSPKPHKPQEISYAFHDKPRKK